MSTESDKPRQNPTGRVTTSGDIEVTTYLEIAKEKGGGIWQTSCSSVGRRARIRIVGR